MKRQVAGLLRKIVSGEKMFLRLRDAVFANPAEHLYRANAFIRMHGLEGYGSAILDIGAADGGTCIYFSKKFPGHHVFGFEPQRAMFEAARRRCSGLRNVTLQNVALSHEKTEALMYVSSDKLSSSLLAPDTSVLSGLDPAHALKIESRSQERVSVLRLDDVAGAGPFLLMKLDTQGTELDVLRGGKETLVRTRLVLVEMNIHRLYSGACSYFEVDAHLRDAGFVLRDIIVTYRPRGIAGEYDALYENLNA